MRITIERMRTLVLAAGVLLVASLAIFLAVGKWKNPFNSRDIPQRLGLDIQQEANGWTYTHGQRGHTLYKIHASKVVQLKQGNHLQLHDVTIELYSVDGKTVDRIEGSEFEYDPQLGAAKATGPVEITLERPGEAPAIAPKATPQQAVADKTKSKPIASAAEAAERGEIHVKTSGLSFDQNSGIATTSERVEFTLAQGSGSSMGASYNSDQGSLVLDRAVEMTTQRGSHAFELHAQHAEFDRDSRLCRLRSVIADTEGREATAADAKLLFRDDGSVVHLDAMNGFTLTTVTGGRLSAPIGHLDFDEQNQPHYGHLEGGVTMDSVSQNRGLKRAMHGTAPTAELDFTPKGQLCHARLSAGVEMRSDELSQTQSGPQRISRLWRSPVADLDFRNATAGQLELSSIHGTGGVVITGESQLGKAAVLPSRLAAEELTGQFGAASALTEIIGSGHADVEETTATGTHQSTSGDRMEARFAVNANSNAKITSTANNASAAPQIQSAFVEGHVLLTQQPAAKPGQAAAAPLHAWAGKAVYENVGQWLHLTVKPRVEDGAMQLTSEKIDISRDSGDAYARGNVKASWLDAAPAKNAPTVHPALSAAGQDAMNFGGRGPAHVVAAEAQMHQATGEATFRGQARLWQQANSIAAPVIVIDRNHQTLTAHTSSASEPVRAVLVSAAPQDYASKSSPPSVIRLRGGDLWYSDAAREGIMRSGVLGNVATETGTASSVSNEVDVILLPAANHAAANNAAASGQAQIDRVVARGHVTVTSEGRHGSGEQLVYTSSNGEYVLTGTAAEPPKMTDPTRGTVTGAALIFHSRDESVSVEGGRQKTTTITTAPK